MPVLKNNPYHPTCTNLLSFHYNFFHSVLIPLPRRSGIYSTKKCKTYYRKKIKNSESNDLEVCFTSTSQNAETLIWNFGNGKTNANNVTSPCSDYDVVWQYDVSLFAFNDHGSDSVLKTISLVGLDEVSSTTKIFPNPASDVLYIQSMAQIKSIRMFNINGDVVEVDEEQHGVRERHRAHVGAREVAVSEGSEGDLAAAPLAAGGFSVLNPELRRHEASRVQRPELIRDEGGLAEVCARD